MSTRFVNALFLTTIMILMSLSGLVDNQENQNESPEALTLVEPQYATSPGHSVFAEYMGAYWCGPCITASTNLHSLSGSNGDEFTYVSFWESSSSGWPSDSPINRRNHISSADGYTGGIPVATFGDAFDGTYYTVGGQNYDSYFTNGGGMDSNAADYELSVAQAPNGANMDITITASTTSSSSQTVYLYAAVTEEVSPESYSADSTKHPHHVWKKWLLNSGSSGFETFTISSGNSVSKSWSVPINTVRAGGGNTAQDNFLTVAALMDGSHTTWNNVFAAADSNMNPMDLSVTSMTITNDDASYDGFLTGDMLSLDATVRNTGTEDYSSGGSLQFYHVDGATQNPIGQSVSLNSLNVGQSQSISTQFDTSSIAMSPNGLESFRFKMTGTTGENDPVGNNMMNVWMSHDYAPSTDTPVADGQINIARGGTLDFDVSGNARDAVDTLATMTPELETSLSGSNVWTSDWVIAPTAITAPGTPSARYVFTIDPIQTASSGDYDVRARLVDSRGQTSDWSMAQDAFSLMNGLPVVVDPNNPDTAPGDCPAFPGLPTVKVQTNERVSLAGLVCDAETDLSSLVITPTVDDDRFVAWHASAGEVEVNFPSIQLDSTGSPAPQGIGITINDGEDTNTGTLMFSVIENGQPRWQSIPSVSYDEGGSSQVSLRQYLTDSDSNGNPTSVASLSLAIVSVEPSNVLNADFFGGSNTLSLSAIDDDAQGSVVVTVRATDSDGQYSETLIHVHVQNINDAPRFDSTGLDNMVVQVDNTLEVDLSSRLTDVDGDDAEIWATVTSNDGMVQYNPISGMLTATYTTPGQYLVQLSASDSDGASGQWNMAITVVDSMPLTWSNDGSNGDIDVVVTDMYFGMSPNFFVVQLSDVELTNIVATWEICNSQSGICWERAEVPIESSTIRTGQSFVAVNPDTGATLANFDEVKLKVTAMGEDGFDYKSSTITFLAEENPGTQESGDGTEDGNEQSGEGDESSSEAGGVSGAVIAGIVVLVLLFVIAGVLGAMLLRGGKDQQPTVDWGTETAFAAPAAAPVVAAPVAYAPPAPVAPVAAPAVQSVPDYTHLTPGGQYVTGHAGETVYLSPDGTAWTMQADSSFIRTS